MRAEKRWNHVTCSDPTQVKTVLVKYLLYPEQRKHTLVVTWLKQIYIGCYSILVSLSNAVDQVCTPQKLCYIVPVCGNMTLAALPLIHNMQLHSILRPPLKVMEDRSVDQHPQGVHDARPHHQDEVVLC